jgi:hypothetical protein
VHPSPQSPAVPRWYQASTSNTSVCPFPGPARRVRAAALAKAYITASEQYTPGGPLLPWRPRLTERLSQSRAAEKLSLRGSAGRRVGEAVAAARD